jgi:hypothetical protein
MKKILFFGLLMMAAMACKDDKVTNDIVEPLVAGVCDVTDPVNELAWLKARIADLKSSDIADYFYVVQAEYEGLPVFFIRTCHPAATVLANPYDCEGNVIKSDDAAFKVTNSKIIWNTDGFVCK